MSTRSAGPAADPAPQPPRIGEAELRRLCPAGSTVVISGLAAAFARHGDDSGIAGRLRLTHFMAQVAHETDRLRTLVEYGDARWFARYDGRRDLGNVREGDGARYRGRGIFQLTGRANYRRFGALLGLDLEADPARAAEPEIALRVALAYWRERRCNAAADADDVTAVTKLINGGRNGLADRTRLLAAAKRIWTA